MTLSALLRAALPTAVVGAALTVAVTLGRTRWPDLTPATCLPADCFCEAVRTEGLAQPVNALTSLTYVLLGLWALMGTSTTSRGDNQTSALTRAVGAVLVALGIGSFWYHGTLTLIGQVLDVQGMYLLGMLVLVAALVRRGVLGSRAAVWVYLVTCAALAGAQVVAPESRRVLFALVLLPGILLEALPGTTGTPLRSTPTRPFRLGVALLVLAYVVWVLDNTGAVCWPTSPFQGHGVWHVLTAVAAVLVVAHYVRTPGGRARQMVA